MESLYSAFSSGAASEGALSAAGEGAASTAGEAAAAGGEAGAAAGGLGGTGEFATGATAGDLAATSPYLTGAEGIGATAGGEAGLGGTGEFAQGATASDMAAGEGPGFIDQLGSLYGQAKPYLETGQKIMQAGNLAKQLLGGGAPSGQQAPLAVQAPSGGESGGQQNQQSWDDFQRQQEAYWRQMLAGSGNISPTGELPPGVQDMIRRQYSLRAA